MKLSNTFFIKKRHYFGQTLAAGLFVLCVLLALGQSGEDGLLAIVGASALAASAFLVFALPDSSVSYVSHILISYSVALVVGILCHEIVEPFLALHANMAHLTAYEISATFAVTVTMLLTIITHTQHPPACGLSLGLVVEDWDIHAIFVILIAVIFLCIIKRLCGKLLINLG